MLPILAYGAVPQDQRARVQRLEKAVLAPCCYTESVGQHQSEVAVRMRVEIANWVERGRTDQEILGAYAERYGARVLVDPNVLPKGYMLIVPWAVLGLGTLGAGAMLWRWHAASPAPVAPDNRGLDLPDLPEIDED